MENNPTLMSLFSFFFFRLMRETCTGPDVKKRKEKLQTKQTGARKRGMKIKHKLFLLLYLFKKAVGHFVVVFSRRCIVRRYSREDTSASAFKHE
jgi:hypothetical protein